ncbi:MAG: DUF3194 domain-containing protein [Candidatus Heimdallarchaeota archaeon]
MNNFKDSYELDEILDLLYVTIHQFLENRLRSELDQDVIDISIETEPQGGLKVTIDLYLEISPFSKYDVEKVAEEALSRAGKLADEIIPNLVINLR